MQVGPRSGECSGVCSPERGVGVNDASGRLTSPLLRGARVWWLSGHLLVRGGLGWRLGGRGPQPSGRYHRTDRRDGRGPDQSRRVPVGQPDEVAVGPSLPNVAATAVIAASPKAEPIW